MKSIFHATLLLLLISSISAQNISTTEWQKLVPSDALPKNLRIRSSNNNLDLIQFNGKYYFAFRTAPTHFPSKKTRMYILSSDDLQNWTLEQEIYLGYDLREPRFIEYKGKLLFYFFEGSKSPFSFDPRHIWVKEYSPESGWSEMRDTGLNGFVPWRLRTRNDTIFLSAYYGKDIYTANHQSDLRLFVSGDGYEWKPLTEASQVKLAKCEEGEFIFDKEGHLWATVRLEGEGSLIVCADKDKPGDWHCNYSKYKYDSALMFEYGNDIYVVSRRNVDGTMAKAPKWFPQNIREKYNLVKYWLTTKKTALFKLDKATMELAHVMDFPSTGDTAFPGIVQMNDSSFVLMNYSSNIQDKNRNWFSGQLGKTYIYWTILKFGKEGAEVSSLPASIPEQD